MSNLANEKTKTIDLVPGNIFHHSPQAMIKFLSLFSRDDRFKWYTHKWDTSTTFNIDEFIEQQRVTKYVLSDMAYPKESGPIAVSYTHLMYGCPLPKWIHSYIMGENTAIAIHFAVIR